MSTPPPGTLTIASTGSTSVEAAALARAKAEIERLRTEALLRAEKPVVPKSAPPKKERNDSNETAEELRKLKGKLRTYKTYLKQGKRDPGTVQARINEIEKGIGTLEEKLKA